MKCTPTKVINLIIFIFVLFFNFSCSVDTDLLSKTVLEDIADVDNYVTESEDGLIVNSIVFTPISDAYLQDVSSYDHSIIRIEENNRTSYLMFDLSSINGDIIDASFQFTVNGDEGNGNVNVYKGIDSNWNEDNLSTNNAPAIDIGIGAINKHYSIGATELIELSSSNLQTDKTTLILTHSSGNDLAIASKEHPSNIGPKLIVTYQLPQGVQDTAMANSEESSNSSNSGSSESGESGSSGSGESGSSESGSSESGESGSSESGSSESGGNTYVPPPNYGSLKAFPSAYGAGAYASGGRGGAVYVVTNLNDSGAGSFREGAEASGARTIVFAVSGTIRLTSPLTVTADNITIAGQTAPAGGIDITGDGIINWKADNAIIRYVRFRPPFSRSDTQDGVDFSSGLKNIIIDHCSFAWGGDEIISFAGGAPNGVNAPDNITFQRNIMYKGWKGSIMGYSNYRENSGRPTGDFSFNQNLVAHTSHRFPAVVTDDRSDVINNVIHNWYERIIVMNAPSDIDINVIGNYYQNGCNSFDPANTGFKFNCLDYEPSNGTQLIYASGNYSNQNPSATQQQFFTYWSDPKPGFNTGDHVDSDSFTATPFAQLGNAFTPLTAADAKSDLTTGGAGAVYVLDGEGNKIDSKDALDNSAINDVINNTCVSYSYNGAEWNNTSEYINYFNSISSTPINTHPADYDTDKDGMPNAWELSRGLNPNSRDNNEDPDGNGYTNLEEYINLVDF